MDKHGVAEDAEAGLKHVVKGVIAVQGFLQRQVPGRIAEKISVVKSKTSEI